MNLRAYSPPDYNDAIALFRLNTPAYFDINKEQDLEEYLNRFPDLYTGGL